MDPLLIVLTGTAVMVVCLMVLRFHAFLALVIAAFVVCLLTPAHVRQWQSLKTSAVPVNLARSDGRVQATPAKGGSIAPGVVVVFQRGPEGLTWLAESLLMAPSNARGPQSLIGGEGGLTGHAEVWMAPLPAWQQALAKGHAHPMELVADGFGATCGSIGLLILLASIIGECLTASGAADRIVGWILERFGERRAPQAFATSAFILGIPSFFDAVFYLMMPLGRGLAAKTGRDFLLYTLSIVAGATMAHSLVPPTPGPLFAAREFGVPLGTMMLGGTIVGGLSVVAGSIYARWANRRWPLPMIVTREPAGTGAVTSSPTGSGPVRPPSLVLAILPIVLPVLLIGLSEAWAALAPESTSAFRVIRFFGQSRMALLLGTGIAVLLLVRRFQWCWNRIKEVIGAAVASGAVVLMITAAGGAFGAALRQTDVASQLARYSGGTGFGLLTAAFLVTALVRIAQGSATVAMLTASGVVAPVALAMGLPFHPVYLALAVGCGSKPVPWMNDSGFWIIGRMSGMTEAETLRSASVMMSLMGFVGFIIVLLGAWLLPLK